MDLIQLGASLALAVLHLLLFAFLRREQANLYFALFALGFAGMSWGFHALDAGPGDPRFHWMLRFTYTSGILQALALERFAHLVFLDRSPRFFAAMLVWAAGVVAWTWLVSPEGLRIDPVMYLALATTIELLRTVVIATRRPQRPGSWLIYLGLAALALAGAAQSMASLGLLPVGYLPTYSSGVLVFLFSVSVYLSRRFALTARELERQLGEVKRLSEMTLRQERQARRREREARRSEMERRLLAAENERKGRELEAARRLQLSMLPDALPELPGLDLAVRMLTATEVGGDYYDFRTGADGALTLAIGDATGHGLQAGLVVASTKSLFQGLDEGLSLAEAMGRIDRGLRGMGLRRMAMSLTLCRWRPGELEIASAGMPPTLLRRAASGRAEECLFSAPPLGTLRRPRFEERRLTLEPGDAVLFSTDGLAELLDPDDQPLGYAALAEAFEEVAGGGARDTVTALLDRARGWAAGRVLADDLSLLALRVTA